MRNLQFNTNEHICETDRLTDIANRLAVAYTQVEEWRGREKDSESGVSRCKLLYVPLRRRERMRSSVIWESLGSSGGESRY